MLQIGKDTIVSLDLVERYFCCDLEACRGQCCIDGDAGAPVTADECVEIEKSLHGAVEYMLPAGIRAVADNGVSYIDVEGDRVTTLIEGGTCAFACFGKDGTCLCALEKAWRDGKTAFRKPASCHLYPVRLRQYPSYTAVNFHRWKICKPAEVLGRKLGIRAYQFLREPLVARFGQEWYDELCLVAGEYLRQFGDGKDNDSPGPAVE